MLPLLFACAENHGQSARRNSDDKDASFQAPYCDEVTRETVEADLVPDGFSISPRQVIDAAVGDWAGWFDGDTSDAGLLTDAAVEVAFDGGGVELVEEVEVTFSGEGETRAPSPSCPTRWEAPLTVALVAHEGVLDDVFDVILSGTVLDAELPVNAWLRGEVPAESAHSVAEPPFDPAEWDDIELVFDARLAEPGPEMVLSGSIDWIATRPYDRETATDTEDRSHIGGFLVESVEL